MMKVHLLLCLLATLSQACLITRFQDQNTYDRYQLRNMDFPFGGDRDGHGYLVINPKNYQRTSFRQTPQDLPANWTSKYGSVTFSFMGENLPQGGLNEAGLAMQVTVLRNMFYCNQTDRDYSRATVTEMDVNQYVLDNYERVTEIQGDIRRKVFPRITLLSNIVDELHGQVLNYHWGICDSGGDCGLLEYHHGEFTLELYQPDFSWSSDSPFIVTNNDVAALDLEYQRLPAGNLPLPQDLISRTSFGRYANAKFFYNNQNEIMKELVNQPNVTVQDQLFHLLDRCTLHSWNKWQTLFNLNQKKIWYRTRPSNTVNTLDLNTFNFTHSLPETTYLHRSKPGSVNQSDFQVADLNSIRSNFETIATLMIQPTEWADEIVTMINETRAVNLGEAEWQYHDFSHVETLPSKIKVLANWGWLMIKSNLPRF